MTKSLQTFYRRQTDKTLVHNEVLTAPYPRKAVYALQIMILRSKTRMFWATKTHKPLGFRYINAFFGVCMNIYSHI